jgi:hypothetical protein
MGGKRLMSYQIEKSSGFDLIPAGTELECRVEKMVFKATKTDRKYINVELRVRDDVESNKEYKNRVLFKAIWSLKEDSTRYNPVDISNLVNTQEYEGKEKLFNTIEDVINFLTGANMRVRVDVEESDQYPTKNVCKYFFKTSFAPKKVGENKTDQPVVSEKTNDSMESAVTDDDLPF